MYYGIIGLVLTPEDFKELDWTMPTPEFISTITLYDRKYCFAYWGWAEISRFTVMTKEIENIRHSLIIIGEDGNIIRDMKTEDSKGCDDIFDDILSWYGGIEINGNKML